VSVSTTAYVGWIKPKGQPWQSVCDGDTEAVCWRRLLDHGHHGDAMVLPVGQRPDGKRPVASKPTLFAEDDSPYQGARR